MLEILGVSVQVLGMNSRHYFFQSLVYNCIFHLSTGLFKIVTRKKHRLPRVSVHCNNTTKLKIMSSDNLERDNGTGPVTVCYFSLQNIKVLLYYFVFLSRTLQELKVKDDNVDQEEVISLNFNNRKEGSLCFSNKQTFD